MGKWLPFLLNNRKDKTLFLTFLRFLYRCIFALMPVE